MMKKGISVCVLIVLVVLSLTVYSKDNLKLNLFTKTTQTEEKDNNKLEFEQKGIYRKVAFGEEYFVYKFEAPNENLVVYQTIDGIYLVGKEAKKNGISYGNIFMPEGQFLGLSSEYLLFENHEGKIAVSFERRKSVKLGESFYNQYNFEQLSDEQKEAFVYPIECKKVER